MRFAIIFIAGILAFVPTPATAKDTELFVLGALHGLHEQEESFGFEELQRVIEAIDPDVMLLEVTPEELAGRLDTKGRPEYPKVIWSMIRARGISAHAMEPGQPLYGELTGNASKSFTEFKAQSPAADAALAGYSKATSELLLAHWNSVADSQDEATDALARARGKLNAAMVAGSEDSQRRWDAVMVDVARKAILANPGKRILVLGSYRNRFMFVEELSGMEGVQLADMKTWLSSKGFGRK